MRTRPKKKANRQSRNRQSNKTEQKKYACLPTNFPTTKFITKFTEYIGSRPYVCHVTSRHVTSRRPSMLCVVVLRPAHSTQRCNNRKPTVSGCRRRCRSSACARDCHLRKKKKKTAKKLCFFPLLSPSPSSVVVALREIKVVLNQKKNRPSLHCGTLPFDHHYYYYYYSSTNHHHHHHQPPTDQSTDHRVLL